jgi:ribosome-interacting GTPase 1
MLKAKDMRRKIAADLKGKSEAEQIRIIEDFIQDWPTNIRGEYVDIRRHLVRRLDKLQTVRRVISASGATPDDPFVVAKAGNLTAMLVGLPNAGKSYVFNRLGGDGATVAEYPFSTTTPSTHLASLDNLTLQVVDLPPITDGTVEAVSYGGKLPALLAIADVVCVVVDLSGDVASQEETVAKELDALGVDPGASSVLVLGNRASDDVGPEIVAGPFALASRRFSLRSDADYDEILPQIARSGGYIPVLAKPPDQSPEDADRFWVEDGATARILASTVHKDLARRLTGARVWGDSTGQPGQIVPRDHPLSDGDVVELITA